MLARGLSEKIITGSTQALADLQGANFSPALTKLFLKKQSTITAKSEKSRFHCYGTYIFSLYTSSSHSIGNLVK